VLAAADSSGERWLLGIAGPPGAGKTKLAHALVNRIAEQRGKAFAVVAPMDGFHLPNRVLEARGLREVKGGPETFDVDGFVLLLRRARNEAGTTVLWPEFDRKLDEPTRDAIAISPLARLVIAEGNYLLLDRPRWREVRALLDEAWYLDAPRELLRKRLLERRLVEGRSEKDALRHVDGSDLPNADLVEQGRALADRVVRL
jgi:pantothenate kinase